LRKQGFRVHALKRVRVCARLEGVHTGVLQALTCTSSVLLAGHAAAVPGIVSTHVSARLSICCAAQPQAAAERKRAGGPRKAGSKANLSGMDAGAGGCRV
jgi:hypothetical protein